MFYFKSKLQKSWVRSVLIVLFSACALETSKRESVNVSYLLGCCACDQHYQQTSIDRDTFRGLTSLEELVLYKSTLRYCIKFTNPLSYAVM